MKNKKERKNEEKERTEWFIETFNQETTTVITDEYSGVNSECVLADDGSSPRVFPVEWRMVEKMKAAAPTATIALDYRVYSRQGGSKNKAKLVSFFGPKASKGKGKLPKLVRASTLVEGEKEF